MPDNTENVVGYAQAADLYWNHGWRGVLPLRRGHKHSPPTGHTGKAGVDPSYPDLLQWIDLYPDGNLALRLAPTLIGIDVDAYGAKTGADALAEAEKRWGALPHTVRSTSRTDGISGIRIYTIPAGERLVEGIDFPELGIGDIEIVQHHHRYVLSWPSIHPEGATYWWLNHDGQNVAIPEVDEIPPLPPRWLEALRAGAVIDTALDGGVYATRDALTKGGTSPAVAERLRQAIKELNLPGQSRHDTVRGHVLALLRLGKRGESGVEAALQALGEMFIALVAVDRPGGREEATSEYRAMVTGTGAARELAKPSNTEWAAGIAAAVAVEEVAESEPVADDNPPLGELENIEADFWTARPELRLIHQAALARMASPWAVLAICAARLLCLVPPSITLPPIIGGPGSLNWFVALSAKSGGGKGAAMSVAQQLVDQDILVRGIGSGEGMIECYQRSRKADDDTPPVISVLFSVDEIDSLGAMGGRSGQTTMSILRSGFSGESLGFSYRGRQNETVPAHTYRMALVASVQPQRAGVLFEDAGGGTPQRFMWFPARDRRIGDEPPPWPTNRLGQPEVLAVMSSQDIAAAVGTIELPEEIAAELRRARAASMSGDADALDSHALFAREKLAYALAFMNARTAITLDDWRLAGIAAQVSDWCRGKALEGYLGGKEVASRERGHQRALERDEQEIQEQLTTQRHINRIVKVILRHVREDGPQTVGAINRVLTSRDRPRLPAALQTAAAGGLLALSGEAWGVGPNA